MPGGLEFTATDLVDYLACHHKLALQARVARGELALPADADAASDLLRDRGLLHEETILENLRNAGAQITDLTGAVGADLAAATVAAMRAGAECIYQGALASHGWYGRVDVLRRTTAASKLGDYSYEPWELKLARRTRAAAVLQACLYSQLLGEIQGMAPEHFQIVSPIGAERFRYADFAAYLRSVQRQMTQWAAKGLDEYPQPVPHCDVCRWAEQCEARRREDDHLSFVAGMTRQTEAQLAEQGCTRLESLANFPVDVGPPASRPRLRRLRAQAQLQLNHRVTGKHEFRVLPWDERHGFNTLPPPSAGDLFLDLEGDPFVEPSGREFLFGISGKNGGEARYAAHWGLTQPSELGSFEASVDAIIESRRRDPAMHVYHFGHYEPSAFRRLMGRYGTREAEVDDLLREGVFVDLHRVVKLAIQASVESYGLKALEGLIGYQRTRPLRESGAFLAAVGRHVAFGEGEPLAAEVKLGVEAYNRDDCLATAALRDWLEARRSEASAAETRFRRPEPREPQPVLVEMASSPLRDALVTGLPLNEAEWSTDHRALRCLADLLEFHRREEKPQWWDYFRLKEATDEELLDDRKGVAGLEFVEKLPGARSPIERFRFPPQELDFHVDDHVHHRDYGAVGTVKAVDRAACTLDIVRRRDQEGRPLSSLFVHSVVPTTPQREALRRVAQRVVSGGIAGPGKFRAARELLLRSAPRLRRGLLVEEGESAVSQARRCAVTLDESVLPIQGPPGSGKTYAGAQMICACVADGLKVGVTANSHSVIRKLLLEALRLAAQQGRLLDVAEKVDAKSESRTPIQEVMDNATALDTLRLGSARVLGATTWLWSSVDAEAAVDVLIIDEAGQMSLANAVAASTGARAVVLLGDPQQLEQPLLGSHPPWAEASVLEHLLDGAPTIHPDRGIFLPETRRLHPSITRFTSEVFYEGRLSSMAGLDKQALVQCPPFEGAGLWFIRVPHAGSTTSSTREAEVIAKQIRLMLRRGAWTDGSGISIPLGPDDILCVAPYNAQVFELSQATAGTGVRVGTVDRFQGQEAPIVFYSMASSSADDAPRGLEFLYSLNRLNVATSRAKCASIVVASPRLLEPVCDTPAQMRLCNALCRYAELAIQLTV